MSFASQVKAGLKDKGISEHSEHSELDKWKRTSFRSSLHCYSVWIYVEDFTDRNCYCSIPINNLKAIKYIKSCRGYILPYYINALDI